MWTELLAQPAPDPRLPLSTAYWHALRGTAFAATGRVAEALEAQAAFEAARAKVPEGFSWGSNPSAPVLAVAQAYLAGEIAFSQGKVEEAVARLTEAATLEDALKYDEPPAAVIPSRHALGAVLMSAQRFAEAEAVYRADLQAYPANYWSTLGLAQALKAQGKPAAKAEAALRKAQARADQTAETSCACVKGR
jgi:tetratricopeptide (TPR) repeat protein